MKYDLDNMNQQGLPAGTFSTWLRSIRKALRENHGMEVPCGTCIACCRSSHFIHINAEETRTLRRIPKGLLFPAPLRPKGNMVLGYDKQGRCPMLVRNKCSIYRNRPVTCRSFDCRLLAASGLAAEHNFNNLIFQQAQRWIFRCPSKNDLNLLSAVQNAARFLTRHPECIQDKRDPIDEIQLSVLAIKVYDVFIKNTGEFGKSGTVSQDLKISKAVKETYTKFEKQCSYRRATRSICPR
jgi:uncharacterized protein